MKSVFSFVVIFLLSISAVSADVSDNLERMSQELNGSCNYAPTQKLKDDKKLSCIVSKLSERCNEIDDCYSNCLGTDLDETVGGGCAHICNYSNRVKWSPPKSVQLCANE